MHFRDLFSKQCALGTFGLILAGFGTLFAIFWLDLFETQVENHMKLIPNSKTYEMWKSPPLPMSLDIYLFNWTNPHDFTNKSTKPILVQLGPYVYVEKPDKTNIVWHPENSTVSFNRKSLFYFDAEKSNGSLDDVITTVNIISAAAAESVRYKSYMEQKKVSVGLSLYNQQIHVTKTAREFLFEGYEDDMISAAKYLASDVDVPFERVGWFYGRNDSDVINGRYNMHTGESDLSKIGKILNWNYDKRTNFYPAHCGMVNGSAGEFYPPKQTKVKPISFFSPDFCRSIPFHFEEELKVEGITGYKYIGGPRTVDNGTIYPDNWCFYTGDSVPSGVMNITACRYGAPIFMSFPHFHAADPYFLNMVEGLKPSKDKHQFYMTLEPNLGIALDVAARFQLNILIRSSTNVALYQDVPTVFFPIVWFEQTVQINPEMAAELRQIFIIPIVGHIISGIVISIGVIMMLWFPIGRLLCHRRRGGSKKTIQNGHDISQLSANPEKLKFSGADDVELPLIHTNGVRGVELKPCNLKQLNSVDDKIKENERYT